MLAGFETEKGTNGRGKSFAGLLKYLLHDKKQENDTEFPTTSDRVTVLAIGNIARLANREPNVDAAKLAYREMKAVCERREA